jgi:PII-like signaling protein
LGLAHIIILRLRQNLALLMRHPIVIVFVDKEKKVVALIPHLKDIVSEGLIIAHRVDRV